MDLEIKNQSFVITGATSGIGRAIAENLLNEGAQLIINARNLDNLEAFRQKCPEQIEILHGDIMTDATISQLTRKLENKPIHGIVINAAGPPPKSFNTTILEDWDDAYESLLRWKIKLTQAILPFFQSQSYGRLLFVESASVKQPIENLILSNSLRLAVVGFVKTLSQEIADQGITLNILAPGYHATPRMEQLFENRAMLLGISPSEAKSEFIQETLMGKLGDPDDLGSLAAWLLSPKSKFITGQTISVDGGLIKSIFS